tara:strand:- start:3848 stop:5188 length:1341 start_codon:yes stop_codon:yes gene_type:complete
MSKNYNLEVNRMAATPKAYKVSKADFHSNQGLIVKIGGIIKDIKVKESLYTSSLVVDLFILDSIPLIDYLKIAGNEKIELVIERRDIKSKVNKQFKLEVYIAEVRDYSTPTPSSKAYTLHCVSKHAYINNVKVLTQSFNNTPSFLINSIVTGPLSSKIDIRNPSTTPIKGIYPRIRPLAAISWLLRNAYEDSTPSYFYETAKSGLVFDSYKKILEKKVYDTYDNNPNYKETSQNSIEELYEEERKKIQKILGQTLNLSKYNASAAGAFGSTLHKIDIYDKSSSTVDYSYNERINKLNDNAPITDKILIDGQAINKFKKGKNYFVSYNSGSFDSIKNYHAPTDQSMLKAEAYHHNLNTVKQELLLTGDFDFEVGIVINLKLLKSADITQEIIASEEKKDETLSGNHLVTGIVHHFGSEGYFMSVTAKKDSFIRKLEGIKGDKNDTKA